MDLPLLIRGSALGRKVEGEWGLANQMTAVFLVKTTGSLLRGTPWSCICGKNGCFFSGRFRLLRLSGFQGDPGKVDGQLKNSGLDTLQ